MQGNNFFRSIFQGGVSLKYRTRITFPREVLARNNLTRKIFQGVI